MPEHAHGVAVVVKGVEADGQVAAAHAAGIDRIQGTAVCPQIEARAMTRLLMDPAALLRRWTWARSQAPIS